ncbi:hypothetical protein ACFQ2B_30185 [Streptomyces stramineus]
MAATVDDGAVRGTSDWMAAVRAEEYERPDRCLADPYAHLLADDAARAGSPACVPWARPSAS